MGHIEKAEADFEDLRRKKEVNTLLPCITISFN